MSEFRDRYIQMRNEKKYDLQFFYDYYLSEGGKVTDGDDFMEIFLYNFIEQPMPPGFPPMRVRTGEVDKQTILDYLDGVFNVVVINDKDGNFLKAVDGNS